MLESRAREIQITDVRRSIFISLMEYLYTDYLDVAVDVAMELFVTADQVCNSFRYDFFSSYSQRETVWR